MEIIIETLLYYQSSKPPHTYRLCSFHALICPHIRGCDLRQPLTLQTVRRPLQTVGQPLYTVGQPLQTVGWPLQTVRWALQTARQPLQTVRQPLQWVG